MTSAGGRHVPGTPYNWEHGYIPLNAATAAKNRKGSKVVESLRKKEAAGKAPRDDAAISRDMDRAIRAAAGRTLAERTLTSKAPRDLAPGDVIHYQNIPVTVLSHPREGAVRGYKTVWGRRHDTGKEGRVDFLNNDPMKVHDQQKVSPSEAKTHQTNLKANVEGQRERLNNLDTRRSSQGTTASRTTAVREGKRDTTGAPAHYMNELAATRNAVHRALTSSKAAFMLPQSDGSWIVQDGYPATKPYVRVRPPARRDGFARTEWVR